MAANPVRTALHTRLSTNAPIVALVGSRIYFQVAPQSATYPLVVFHKQSGTARRFADLHALQDDLWTVKGIATSAAKAEEVADAVDTALDGFSLSVTGRDTISLLRESDVDFAETEDGTTYRHAGALYRLRTE